MYAKLWNGYVMIAKNEKSNLLSKSPYYHLMRGIYLISALLRKPFTLKTISRKVHDGLLGVRNSQASSHLYPLIIICRVSRRVEIILCSSSGDPTSQSAAFDCRQTYFVVKTPHLCHSLPARFPRFPSRI